MAIICLECNHTFSGTGSLHLISECPECGNTKRDGFMRVDDEDIDPEKYEKDKEWLEALKEKKNTT